MHSITVPAPGKSATSMWRVSSEWVMPLALLALSLLTFAPLITRLGFYWDDWPVILTGQQQGTAGFWQFYQYDRPISAWTYVLTYPLFGSTPIYWHIFSMLLRWGTAVAIWWMLRSLWPAHPREVNMTALLFLVYPIFTQQSISVAYSQHWICYLSFAVSIASMIQAQRWRETHRNRFFFLTMLSLFTELLHLLTLEYFAGLELLRPLLLWYLSAESTMPRRQRIAAVFWNWLPYLAVLIGFGAWRFLFLKFLDRTPTHRFC